MQTNILNQPLQICSLDPMSGFYRDGSCRTSPSDHGKHCVCAIMTDEFLEFSKNQGNDLITPAPHFAFPGLKAGDKWCLCVLRWKEAYDAGCAPILVAEATSMRAADFVDLNILLQFAQK